MILSKHLVAAFDKKKNAINEFTFPASSSLDFYIDDLTYPFRKHLCC